MSTIGERLLEVRKSLPAGVELVAVSKFHPKEDVMEAYNTGQRIFGENIVQELRGKQEALPKDIQWHFIGHLQSNKVKYIAPFVSLIHSVDTFKLLEEINRQAQKNDRVIPVLLQIHVAKEETKFGFTIKECDEMLAEQDWRSLDHVQISGLMCMASNVPDANQIHSEFSTVSAYFQKLHSTIFADKPQFKYCSWGMSSDYPIAVQEGSNMVRVGSHIFGPRPKTA